MTSVAKIKLVEGQQLGQLDDRIIDQNSGVIHLGRLKLYDPEKVWAEFPSILEDMRAYGCFEHPAFDSFETAWQAGVAVAREHRITKPLLVVDFTLATSPATGNKCAEGPPVAVRNAEEWDRVLAPYARWVESEESPLQAAAKDTEDLGLATQLVADSILNVYLYVVDDDKYEVPDPVSFLA